METTITINGRTMTVAEWNREMVHDWSNLGYTEEPKGWEYIQQCE